MTSSLPISSPALPLPGAPPRGAGPAAVPRVERGDVAIVGGGLAGSMTAALLARSGIDAIAIDPHDVFPRDFRCEKLEQGHVDLLQRTGLAEAVMRASTRTDTLWVARFGRVVDVSPFRQYGMAYEDLVNTMRSEIPPHARRRRAWVQEIDASADRQRLRLSDGGLVDARLVVLANGISWKLHAALGINRDLASTCHSITIGFNLRRADGADFDFPALQYNPERTGNGVAYLCLFRIGSTMRANLFVYRPLKSEAVSAFRHDATAALRALLPGLDRITGPFTVEGPVKVRPTDLHVVRDYRMPGVVLAGDAFCTPCPATGTGTMKVFTDVERLCNEYIPRWLSSDGMSAQKIGTFYDDSAKAKCDQFSVEKAYQLRAISTDASLRGEMRRHMRYYNRLIRWRLRLALRRCTAA